MSTPPHRFLGRRFYRQRRLRDLIRLVPFIGLVLVTLPLAYGGKGEEFVSRLLYLFGVWIALIGFTALCNRLIDTSFEFHGDRGGEAEHDIEIASDAGGS